MTILIKNANKKTILETNPFWIGHEIVFDYIVNMIYNDGEPYGMDPNKTYLFEQKDIDYAITICNNMLNDKNLNEDFPNHKRTTKKVIKTLQNIGDKCYIIWDR